MYDKLFVPLVCSLLLALIVITLGAYVRLSDAGLGCPDWPGCYGRLVLPSDSAFVEDANQIYPERPVESEKAWKEMIHRYAAGILLLLVFFIAVRAWKDKQNSRFNSRLSIVLLCLIIFQALLGMWTVTLLLKPVIVLAHLLGGMTVLLLLSWLMHNACRHQKFPATEYTEEYKLLPLAFLGLVVVYIQISLGGWTSANYAALVCPDLPTCQGKWLPPMDFSSGFTFWTGLGKNYEFGILDVDARTAIHFSHRIGALFTFIVIGWLSICAIMSNSGAIRFFGFTTLFLLITQVCLGLLNIKWMLPIYIAVAHNGVAALLLVSVGSILYYVSYAWFSRKKLL